MPISPTRVALVLTVVVALGFVWYYEGRGRWRSLVEDRFVHGVPWGTAVTVAVVVAFYLLAQGGWRHWGDPLVLPFVTWSYLYPTGLLTAGIAHGSPEHLVSNVAGTLVLAPIAEYAWGHYPPSDRTTTSPEFERAIADGGVDGVSDWLRNPRIRAFVLFPGALLGAAFVTGLLSMGPGLGFSGAVFAIAGFAVVNRPLATVVGVVATNALQLLFEAMSQPVVRETIDPGPPVPPEWAGIGFQAHLLGFLLGVLVGIALLRRRGRRPSTERVFFATLLFGMAQALWLVAWGADDTFYLYQGAGVAFVFLLTTLVTVAVAGSDRALPRPLSGLSGAPTRRRLAGGWLVLVALGFGLGLAGVATGEVDAPLLPAVGLLVVLGALLALPALPPLVPDRWFSGPVTRREAAIACLCALTLLVALPSLPLGLVAVGDGAVPGSGGVEAGDYTVTYEQDAPSGQSSLVDLGGEEASDARQSGVIVVSDDRELWSVAVSQEVLEHEGSETVEVGGIGWRESIHVDRTGWEVLGSEPAYVVDLEHDGETTRSFGSEPARANAQLDGHAIDVVPADDGFLLRVSSDGSTVGETAIPEVGETATVGEVEFSTEEVDGSVRVFAASGGSEVQIAQRETYDPVPEEADADAEPPTAAVMMSVVTVYRRGRTAVRDRDGNDLQPTS